MRIRDKFINQKEDQILEIYFRERYYTPETVKDVQYYDINSIHQIYQKYIKIYQEYVKYIQQKHHKMTLYTLYKKTTTDNIINTKNWIYWIKNQMYNKDVIYLTLQYNKLSNKDKDNISKQDFIQLNYYKLRINLLLTVVELEQNIIQNSKTLKDLFLNLFNKYLKQRFPKFDFWNVTGLETLTSYEGILLYRMINYIHARRINHRVINTLQRSSEQTELIKIFLTFYNTVIREYTNQIIYKYLKIKDRRQHKRTFRNFQNMFLMLTNNKLHNYTKMDKIESEVFIHTCLNSKIYNVNVVLSEEDFR